jgi:hypothetical protein
MTLRTARAGKGCWANGARVERKSQGRVKLGNGGGCLGLRRICVWVPGAAAENALFWESEIASGLAQGTKRDAQERQVLDSAGTQASM